MFRPCAVPNQRVLSGWLAVVLKGDVKRKLIILLLSNRLYEICGPFVLIPSCYFRISWIMDDDDSDMHYVLLIFLTVSTLQLEKFGL